MKKAKPETEANKKRRAYGISESAWALSISRDTIRRAIKNEQIGTIRIGDRVLIPAEEIDRVAKEGL